MVEKEQKRISEVEDEIGRLGRLESDFIEAQLKVRSAALISRQRFAAFAIRSDLTRAPLLLVCGCAAVRAAL